MFAHRKRNFWACVVAVVAAAEHTEALPIVYQMPRVRRWSRAFSAQCALALRHEGARSWFMAPL